MPCDVVRVQVLMLCIFAGALDSLGDEGNRFARSTIMPQSFPVTKNPSTMSLISSSNVLATGFCMFLVMGTQKKMGLAVYTVFGNAFSALVQFSLIFFVVSADLTPTLTQLSSSPLASVILYRERWQPGTYHGSPNEAPRGFHEAPRALLPPNY